MKINLSVRRLNPHDGGKTGQKRTSGCASFSWATRLSYRRTFGGNFIGGLKSPVQTRLFFSDVRRLSISIFSIRFISVFGGRQADVL